MWKHMFVIISLGSLAIETTRIFGRTAHTISIVLTSFYNGKHTDPIPPSVLSLCVIYTWDKTEKHHKSNDEHGRDTNDESINFKIPSRAWIPIPQNLVTEKKTLFLKYLRKKLQGMLRRVGGRFLLLILGCYFYHMQNAILGHF